MFSPCFGLVLKDFNRRLREMRIPLNTWRTNDPGHLHIKKLPPNPNNGPSANSASSYSASSLSNRKDSAPVPTPPLHDGSGGVITEIDWDTITTDDLLTGRFDESLLEAAEDGPTGTQWGMEEFTENQARLALTILAFVIDSENNADIDIPLEKLWSHMELAEQIRRNPEARDRAARMVRFGLKHLRYIIGQHSQDYHPSEDDSDQDSSAPDENVETVALAEAASADVITADTSSTPAPDRNTYLPIQANWWMHDFSYR